MSFRPYKEIAIEYAAEEKNRTVDFLSFPIPGIVHPHVLTIRIRMSMARTVGLHTNKPHITCAYDN